MAERTRRVLGLLKLNYNIYIYTNLILRYVKENQSTNIKEKRNQYEDEISQLCLLIECSFIINYLFH